MPASTHEYPDGADDSFGRSDWILVGTVVFALVVVPALILIRPPTDVSFRFAYLIVPLVPALGLGVAAVWSALRAG